MSIPAYVGTHHADGESKIFSHSFRTFTNGGTKEDILKEIKNDWLNRIWGDHECHVEQLPHGAAIWGAITIIRDSVSFKTIGFIQADPKKPLFEVECSCHYVVWEDLLTDGGDTPPHGKDGSEPPW